jgi:UDP-N-acetylglucosamine:LPS N-acetylglucosamine transferase
MTGPVVITGGGTGGHIFPMQAVAEALCGVGLSTHDIRYVGSTRGQEGRLLGHGPIALTLLPGRGIRRSLSLQACWQNAGALVGLVRASVMGISLVARWRPRAVVSVGGYASFAVSLGAVLCRRPLVLIDLDAHAPLTHRLLRRWATRRCVAFGVADERTVVTGAPFRHDIASILRAPLARDRARASVVPPIEQGRHVIVVMTGSLGSRKVNEMTLALAGLWSTRSDVTLIHVTGRRDEAWVREQVPTLEGLDYRILDFADMTTWWAVADVAVCRAGATTVAELCTLGIASVLVPLPGAPGDHQSANARVLSSAGGAMVFDEASLTPAKLAAALTLILGPDQQKRMELAALTLSRRDAAAAIAETVVAVSR